MKKTYVFLDEHGDEQFFESDRTPNPDYIVGTLEIDGEVYTRFRDYNFEDDYLFLD